MPGQPTIRHTVKDVLPKMQPLCIPHFNTRIEDFYNANVEAARLVMTEASLLLANYQEPMMGKMPPAPQPRVQPRRVAKQRYKVEGGATTMCTTKRSAIAAASEMAKKRMKIGGLASGTIPGWLQRRVDRIRAGSPIRLDKYGNVPSVKAFHTMLLAQVTGEVCKGRDRENELRAMVAKKNGEGVWSIRHAQGCLYGGRPWACGDCTDEMNKGREACLKQGIAREKEFMVQIGGYGEGNKENMPEAAMSLNEKGEEKKEKKQERKQEKTQEKKQEKKNKKDMQLSWEGKINLRNTLGLGDMRFVVDTCHETMVMLV
jgi:hypothetical protein